MQANESFVINSTKSTQTGSRFTSNIRRLGAQVLRVQQFMSQPRKPSHWVVNGVQ